MADDVLDKLQELAAIPELTEGFKTQRDCISWGNKVLPLLSFNTAIQNEFISYQKNINTLGLSADLQGSSLHQMITILHLAISERQKAQSNIIPISDKLMEYGDRFVDINSRFIDRDRSLHLSTEDEAYFKQQVLEVISLINEAVGDNNQYAASIRNTVNSDRGMYGPSRHCVQSVRGIIMAAQTEIKRKESKALAPPRSKQAPPASLQSGEAKKVFVVHGRNNAARDAMFSFLRALSLQPIEWSEAVRLTGKTSPFIGEILDAAFAKAQAVVVLMTPDDVAYLDHRFRSNDDPPYEKNPTPQARPNVLFEAGMSMGRDPDRTILVELGSLRPFSDIGGRHVVRINNSTQRRQDLAERLAAAGCEVNLSGRDWHSVGDFDGSIASTVVNAAQVTSVSRRVMAKHDFEKVEPKMAKDTFEKLKGKMFDLFVEMKSDLEGDNSQLVREFVVLSKGVVFNHGGKARFEYREDEHPMLKNKVDMLIESGLVVDVTPKEYPVYRMTEEFVEQLVAMQV